MKGAATDWLIIGASGLLGHHLCRHLLGAGHAVAAVRRSHPMEMPGLLEIEADILRRGTCARLVRELRPRVTVYAAGLTDVDACERREAEALSIHAEAAAEAAEAAKGAPFVYVSTDHLWAGDRALVTEDEKPHPVNAYARTKLAGERAVTAAHPAALILRTNFFGEGRPWRRSLSDWILGTLRAGRPLSAFTDVHFTPIEAGLLSGLVKDCVAREAQGILHLCGGERLSKFDFARRLAVAGGYRPELVEAAEIRTQRLAAPRPGDMSLDTTKAARLLGRPLPDIDLSFRALLRS
jgi:dTDP-4-dehydrorhamnose reductase